MKTKYVKNFLTCIGFCASVYVLILTGVKITDWFIRVNDAMNFTYSLLARVDDLEHIEEGCSRGNRHE